MDIFAEEFNVKSNLHFEGMKNDLISLSTNNVYFDIECKCKDGTLKTNRFYIGIIFPQITDQPVALLPDYTVREITEQIRHMFGFMSHMEGYNDMRQYELSIPEVNEDPLAFNPPSDIRKILPRSDVPIDPGNNFAMHFLEGDTNMYTARPQAPPQPQVINRPNVPTTYQNIGSYITQPTIPASNQQSTISYGYQSSVPNSQPKKVFVQQAKTNAGQSGQNYPICVDQYGNRVPLILKPLTASQAQTYQTVKTLPAGQQPTYVRQNGSTFYPGMLPRQPNLPINKGVSRPPSVVAPRAADQVLVAKAPVNSIPVFSKSGSIMTASSIKSAMNKYPDNITPRDKIFDSKGRCIGYKANNGNNSEVTFSRPNKVKLVDIQGDTELSDDDTIEVVESGVHYLVNSVKAKIKRPRVTCKNVKLSATQLAAVAADEAAQESFSAAVALTKLE